MSFTTVSQGKANWDHETTQYFIQACLNQYNKGERNGTTLTKRGWQGVMLEFNTISGKRYERPQLKNKWDSLKKEWQAWWKLFGKETGLGWDSARNTVDAPDDWWEKKIAENPQYARFRMRGLPFVQELTTLFKDVVATGQYAWAPTSGILPEENNDEVYRPTMDDIAIDTDEGNGDSENDLNPALPTEMRITPPPPEGTSSQRSGEKRKRASVKKGKGKKPASTRIADAVSMLAETCRSRTDTVNKIVATVPGSTTFEVISELTQIEAIRSDLDFYNRCCNLMIHKQAREMFMGMRGTEDLLVSWLRFVAYNPPDFKE